jgi:hypothetical protein
LVLKRPARGPTMMAPTRPATPPLMCTTPLPAKSITRPSEAPPQLSLPLNSPRWYHAARANMGYYTNHRRAATALSSLISLMS